MKHTIIGSTSQFLEVFISKTSNFRTVPQSIVVMDPYLAMNSKIFAGHLEKSGFLLALWRLIKRKVSGEKMALINLEHIGFGDGTQRAIVAPNYPGEIAAFSISPEQTLICRKGAFLCSEGDISISFKIIRKASLGLLTPIGLILQYVEGTGNVFFTGNGSLHKIRVTDELIVDTQNLVAFTSSLSYETYVPDTKSMMFAGEGLFMIKFRGEGSVWIQSYEHDQLKDLDMKDLRESTEKEIKLLKKKVKSQDVRLL